MVQPTEAKPLTRGAILTKAARVKRGLTLSAAGALCGVTGTCFRMWEDGENRPSADRRDVVFVKLGVPPGSWATSKAHAKRKAAA